jgi:arginine decarboxylase
LVLSVASAAGTGTTELSAFDDALLRVGAANYNLVRLSSVIPPGSTVVEHEAALPSPGGAWGDRLYVVYAEQRASHPGEEAWAGVGWVQDAETGRGLFVEHEGNDEDEVRNAITASLRQLQHGRGIDLGPTRMRVVGARCVDQPVCALAMCTYATEPWASAPRASGTWR